MDLGNLWSIIAEPDNFLTVLFGFGGFYLGFKQDRYARQYDGAYQNVVELQTLGVVTHNAEQSEPTETVAISFRYRGFETRHGIRLCLTFEEGYFWLLKKDIDLAPGEEFGPKYLEIPRSALPGIHLHVSWPSPHPSLRRRGLRYQALRLNLRHELQEWRWGYFEGLRRRFRRPLGKWKTVENPPLDPKSLPSWPHGRAAKTMDW